MTSQSGSAGMVTEDGFCTVAYDKMAVFKNIHLLDTFRCFFVLSMLGCGIAGLAIFKCVCVSAGLCIVPGGGLFKGQL